MNKPKIYIDGKEGTTGLQIYERLGGRDDLELLLIDEDKRKDTEERRKFLNAADLVFLCLPDAAAVEAVSLIENGNTKVIDASTAHRTAPGWAYGFAELSKLHRAQICESMRVSNPGCHATGFISIVYPLVGMGILPADTPLSCFSLTGYSGGGKKMIAQYEAEGREDLLSSPAIYGITQSHKHLPEMQVRCGLSCPPVFSPIVDDYYKGMATTVPLHLSQLRGVSSLHDVWKALSDYYAGQKLVRVIVKVIHAGVGAINESDVILASASNAIIIGFNVRPDNQARDIAERENVDLRLYRVIYQAIEDVEAAMKGMLDPKYEEKVIGTVEVRQTYKASVIGTIAGSYVLDGMVTKNSSVRVTRGDDLIYDGPIASLKRFKDDVKEVKAGYECGIVLEKFNDIKEGDMMEVYTMVEIPR